MSLEPSVAPPALGDASKRWPMIAGYELLGEIAAGGMATVYLARPVDPRRAPRLVAIKHCHPHLSHDADFVSMFLDEARVAALLQHPNLVSTLDVGNADSLYFVMQYVEGVSLAEWLATLATEEQRLETPIAMRIVLDALAGLAAAHALGDSNGKPLRLVHRDVSPQNLLIGLDGVAKLGDFGIAKAEARATRTRTGQVKGKSGYMSPEQILLEPIDLRSDLYAVGVVLWEALTGRRLFEADSDAATINLVLSGKVPQPSSIVHSDPRLDVIVSQALAFDPAKRFASAEAMGEALRQSGVEVAPPEVVGARLEALFGAKLRERRGMVREHARLPFAARPSARDSGVAKRWWRFVPALAGLFLILFVGWSLRKAHANRVAHDGASPATGEPAAPSVILEGGRSRAEVRTGRTGTVAPSPTSESAPLGTVQHEAAPNDAVVTAPNRLRETSGPASTARARIVRSATAGAAAPISSLAPSATGAAARSNVSPVSDANRPRRRVRPAEYRPEDL